VLPRLLVRARAAEELAQAEVAVGGERAHPQLLGEREGVTVVGLGVFRGIAAGGDLAEEPEGVHLVTSLTALAGKGQRAAGAFESVVEAVGEDVRFAQIHLEDAAGSRCRSRCHRRSESSPSGVLLSGMLDGALGIGRAGAHGCWLAGDVVAWLFCWSFVTRFRLVLAIVRLRLDPARVPEDLAVARPREM